MDIGFRITSFFSLTNAISFIAMVVSYLATIHLSLAYFMVGNIAILWLGNGLATALFLVCSPKRWITLGLGLIVGYVLGIYSHFGVFNSTEVGFLLANFLSVITAVAVFKWLCKEQVSFIDLRQNILFLTILCLLSALVSVIVGTTVQWITTGIFPPIDFTIIWFVGNSVSNFASTLTAFHIFNAIKNKNISMPFKKRQLIELILMCATTAFILVEVFGRDDYNKFSVSMIFLLFPLAMWVALRFNRYVTSFWITLVFLTCGFFSTAELGPFIFMFEDLSHAIFFMQIYIFMACSTALIIGTINTEKETKTKVIAQLNRKLDNLTKIDPLTQLANRRKYDESIQTAIASVKLHNTPLSLIAIDIDYFKLFNDQYGHLIGDNCLVSIANAIHQNLLRTNDLVARMGGEEFFCILPNTDVGAAKNIMHKIQTSINQLNIPHQASPIASYVTVSMGSCTIQAGEETNAMHLYQRADKALYMAKEQGRNQFISVG